MVSEEAATEAIEAPAEAPAGAVARSAAAAAEEATKAMDHLIPSKVSERPAHLYQSHISKRRAEPADEVEIGSFMHSVESEMLCSLTQPTRIPYFNAPIYLSNKTQIGKIDEILGPINEVGVTGHFTHIPLPRANGTELTCRCISR